MLRDIGLHVFKNMRDRLMRSVLTIISILIGIMAIFALVSFGQGLSSYINEIGQQAGADKLIAQPKGFGPPGTSSSPLTKEDFEFFQKANDVSEAAGMIANQAEASLEENKPGKWVFIMGMSTVPSEQRLIDEAFGGIGMLKGRNLKSGDKNKAVIGYNYQFENKIFPKALELGDKVFVNGIEFKIVGFYEEIGNSQDDSNIYITLDDAEALFNIKDEYDFIYLRADKGISPSELAKRLTEKLRKEKGQKEGEETFFIQTFEQLLETFGTVLIVINAILAIIAGISVLVAAVNITNTMYTAVLERTKEVGVMKAIGARNSTILFMFFMESGIIGIIGGALGILLGYGLAKLGGFFAAASGYALLQPAFPWWLIVGCLLFSFLVGAASGYLPAKAASKLKPVDALRYE